MKHILVVCTGNICRSPMAAGLLRMVLEENGHTDIRVASAGTHGIDASPATPYAREAMRARDVDISEHRSRRLTIDALDVADVVLVMEKSHRWYIRSTVLEGADKVRLMSELVGEEYDIRDPYSGSRREYEYIAQELQDLIEAGWRTLVEWLYEEEETASR